MSIDLRPLHNTLADYQLEILNADERYTVTIASTKAGKTYSHAVWLITQFLIHKGHGNFWWVAPIYIQAKIAYRRIKRELLQYQKFRFNESELSISFEGKTMQFKSADNPDGLYGDDVMALVFDEFTRASESAWHACRSTLTKTQGKAKLIGNYTGETNWGVRLEKEMQGNPAWRFFKITAYDAVKAGILSAEEVEQARKDLPKTIFEALYLATGGYEPDRMIQAPQINDLFSNDFIPFGAPCLTADIAGEGSDLFVIMIWSGYRLQKCYTIEKSNSKDVNDLLTHYAHIHSVPMSRICYDRDGLGFSVSGYLPDSIPFNGNKRPISERRVYTNRKAQVHYLGANRINEAGYYIEPDALDYDQRRRLIEELATVKRDGMDKDGLLKIVGKDKIKQAIGRSPDLSDAFFLRENISLILGE